MAEHDDSHPLWQPGRSPRLHKPGDTCSCAGVYRCEVCGDEVTVGKGDTLPSQDHHPHPPGQGPVRWRLVSALEPGI